MSKKLDKARKKAENISDNVDMTDKERQREIKQVYKKAGLLAKKKVDVKYVIAKRGVRGKVAAKGIKGPYKVVDRRLKKDRSRAKAPGEAKKRTPRGKKGTGSFQRGRGSKKIDQKKNKRR
jgi:AdoMet-dependent rRNA methyltransferase SPB1